MKTRTTCTLQGGSARLSDMLGRQTQLYLDTGDASEFMRDVASDLGFVLVADRSSTHVPAVVEVEAVSFMSFLVLDEHVEQLRLKLIPAQGYWLLASRNNPAIEWCRFREEQGVLRSGRLFYESQNHGATDSWAKDATFVAAAESLRRRLRRWCATRNDWGWVGPSAYKRMREGRLTLKP